MRDPDDVSFPDLPDILREPGGADVSLRQIRTVLHAHGEHSLHNIFTVEGEKGNWGFPARFEVASVRVSKARFPDVQEEQSLCPIDDGVHIAIEDSKGRLHGHKRCQSIVPSRIVNGIAMTDSRGRTWLCESEDQENHCVLDPEGTFSGNGPIHRISNATAPIVRHLNFPQGGYLTDLKVWGGFISLERNLVRGALGPITEIDPATPHLAAGLRVMEERLAATVERENRIEQVAGDVLTTDALKTVIARDFPLRQGILPNWNDKKVRGPFDDRLLSLTKEIGKRLRDAGLCAPCPNDGAHKVRGITAWNAFVEGRFDGPEKSLGRDDVYLHSELDDSPFFRTVRYALMNGADAAERKIWTSQHPHEEYDRSKTEVLVTETDLDRVLADLRDEIVRTLKFEDDFPLIAAEFRSSLDSKVRFEIMGGFLMPVLGIKDPETRIIIPVPVEEEPRIARHLELSLPSGRLLMADWFRIDGFNETVRKLCDGDVFEVSYPSARDDQSRAYYERLGLIHLASRGPTIYEDISDVWRGGRVDEDHESFWRKNAQGNHEGTGLCPEPAWGLQTYDYTNTFADVEVVIDILMASEKYGDREEAMAAIDRYVQDGEAHIAEIGAGKLHLYLPTGYGDTGLFTKRFRADELDYPEWRQDSFLISRVPLAVDPEFLEENDWVEGRIDPEISKRSEKEYEPGMEP